ncbi:MAG TPA: ATP-binding cassette domain-containing protein [Spirochaetota bacterium]|jgi:ABC-2 type transport system ATP-binding protein|nr:MAG: putative ABC transporter ATP-binding protein YxlF [Spirochaetes bacterium ADurb.Bin133]HNZ25967.1 ATP-binding cassette domain-containing protein [Spirochaetota bacterium]HPY86508.1 ATP-binding cassette domain-containing protein [Spirochaetota bacterium]HQB61163.1 ATP-binding cassette domain-containing protein [Spirochaetota bacterium]
MINVRNLVKSYGNSEPAVKGVSFDIEKGEIVGLLGPNGAGKTTIMKMLTCFMNPSSGTIEIDGRNTVDDPLYVKKLIGYLPENSPQYDDMTVYEYLKFTAEIRGIEKTLIGDSISKMIKLSSLEKVVSKKIGQLSKGYKKRVGLASVMIHDPKILILDEPTSGLDPNQIITFRKILRRLSEKKTIILSTHILSEIEAICERVIIINNGKIVANDAIQNLIETYSDDQYVDFSVEADNLLEVELEISKVKGAWKIEFVKKESKKIFKFKALVSKGSDFKNNLKEFINSKGWKLTSFETGEANLEEIFLKLAGEEEDK